MKFSMNGFRRSLSRDSENLREITQRIANDDHWEKEDLIEAVNAVITHSNVINSVSQPDEPDFTEMSDIDVAHVETQSICWK